MKKQLSGVSFLFLIIATVIFAAFTPQQKDKNKNKDQQKGQEKEKGKFNKDDNGKDNKNNGKDRNDDKGRNDDRFNKDKNDNNGNGHDWNSYSIYTWNRQTFKDRQRIKDQDNRKVTICHKFRSSQDPVILTVSSNALKAHLSHGDIMGGCPPIRGHYSDIFLQRRNEYYNYLEQSMEKVWYSRSILDYARIRLADSRVQLVTFQNRRMPPADIERKRVVVVQLEQNVSLLEAAVGVTALLLVNQLQ